VYEYLASARFGHHMKFSMLWFTYNKTEQGETLPWIMVSQMLQYWGRDQSIE
jgi:hypothetical protein